VIDIHAHILPGLDDGARNLEESRELARREAAEGVTAIAATPHVRSDYPTRPQAMEAAVAALREDFARTGIPVEVLHGGELALDMLSTLGPEELSRFTLAQTGRYLLVEFPYVGWPLGLERRVFDLEVTGLRPVLAHPERNRDVQASPARLEEAVRVGALVQITAASLDGRIGPSSQRAAAYLLERDLAHVIASDAHSPEIREAGLAAATRALKDGGLARYLTEDAPGAIVAGADLPERPAPRRRPSIRRAGRRS
jgi:protein-tyrosine phosphatase